MGCLSVLFSFSVWILLLFGLHERIFPSKTQQFRRDFRLMICRSRQQLQMFVLNYWSWEYAMNGDVIIIINVVWKFPTRKTSSHAKELGTDGPFPTSKPSQHRLFAISSTPCLSLCMNFINSSWKKKDRNFGAALEWIEFNQALSSFQKHNRFIMR